MQGWPKWPSPAGHTDINTLVVSSDVVNSSRRHDVDYARCNMLATAPHSSSNPSKPSYSHALAVISHSMEQQQPDNKNSSSFSSTAAASAAQ
eukprot:jgi/Chrzof1/9351/UNPLg00322.t1